MSTLYGEEPKRRNSNRVDGLTERFDGLTGMMAQLLCGMKTLADTVTDHRITGLEGAASVLTTSQAAEFLSDSRTPGCAGFAPRT